MKDNPADQNLIWQDTKAYLYVEKGFETKIMPPADVADFKRASNGCFWLDLRYLKTRKGQTCLPLLLEVLKTASAVMKKIFFGGDKQCLQGCWFIY